MKQNQSTSQTMRSEAKQHLHMLFFPFMAQGHMIPMINMANLFAARDVCITIFTTAVNASNIRPKIEDSIHLHIVPFPAADFGLPDGCENFSLISSDDQYTKFYKAICSLRHSFDSALQNLRPDCVVTDIFLPWTYHLAASRGIPRFIFHGTNNFAQCAFHSFDLFHSLKNLANSFVIPGIPHRIEMLKSQVMDINKLAETPMPFMSEVFKEAKEVESKSYGALINSFYELEPEYADRYREIGGRLWNVGPVSLFNKEVTDKSFIGGEQQAEWLKWLDGKPAGSVVYMCFGSGSIFSIEQLREMALGLESAEHPFVWVVRNEGDEWVPEGYEERIEGKGIVIRGWAPQLLILNHAAVGGFVTHCGWNSSLEAICAGLPIVTWPLNSDQFYNEKLLVEVLKIGVAVGSKVYTFSADERPVVKAEAVEAAVRSVMGEGDEAEERRRSVKELAEKARKAVEKGGSSYEEMGKLMQELMNRKKIV